MSNSIMIKDINRRSIYQSPNAERGLLSPFDHDEQNSRLGSSMSNKNLHNLSNPFRKTSFNSLHNFKTANIKQMQRNNSLFSNDSNGLNNLQLTNNLPPIVKLNFDQALQDEKGLMGLKNPLKVYNGKKIILLKKQMSETKLQEFKKRQIEKEAEHLRNETVDNFLSPSKSKPVTAKIIKQDEDGRLQKRSILGTPDIFQQVQNKVKDNIEGSKTKKIVTANPIAHIQGVLKSNISTPQQRMLRTYKSTSMVDNQNKGVAFQNKPLKRPSINVTNQQIEDICHNLEERVRENEKLENKTLQYLPFSLQLQHTQSQRILKQYDSIKNFWEKKKCHLAEKAGKPMSELGLMQSSDELRKKIEASEMIDKTLLNVETLGQTLWKANLRNYHKEANYKTFTKGFSKRPSVTEEYLRKQALKQQQELEKKETSKTFLNLQSLTQCADITSVYLDRSFKPTEIIRTPNFELARIHQESLMNSDYLDNTKDQFDSTLKHHDGNENGNAIGQGWWNDTFKQSIIKEEEEELIDKKSSESLKSTIIMNESENIQNTKPNKHQTLSGQEFNRGHNSSSIVQHQRGSYYSTHYSSMNASGMMNRKKKLTLDMLDQTLRQLKTSHSHLISPTNDDDATLLCIQGQNKLQMEIQAARKIPGPKVLIPRESYMSEDADGFKEKDEIVAINYDIKQFY